MQSGSATETGTPGRESNPQGQSDLTSRAQIRDAALELFAEHGPDAVSVRQIAERSGVSTALVLYHYGSKAGLKEAVDDHAARVFGDLFDPDVAEQLAEQLSEGDATSLAEVFARSFPPDSPLPAYLRRLLLSGDPAGERLFQQWYEATRRMLDDAQQAGYVPPSDDPEVRAAFMLANDLALITLRNPISAALGTDPMAGEGLRRWAREASVIYRDGVWTPETVQQEQTSEHGEDTREDQS